jgi:hypothetical protein
MHLLPEYPGTFAAFAEALDPDRIAPLSPIHRHILLVASDMPVRDQVLVARITGYPVDIVNTCIDSMQAGGWLLWMDGGEPGWREEADA